MIKKLFLLLIIALAVGMAIPSTRAKMEERAQPVLDHFKAKLVPTRLNAMADQLSARVNRGEGYPASFEGWLDHDFTGVPQDPWGNYYFMEHDRRGFTVGSMGPDGRKGTPDDITEQRRFGR
ncbi:MAG: type II secretion system protein GspG [Gemmatimonadota bacterium]|jgi:hypothetical protein